jgi:hypothetical protein
MPAMLYFKVQQTREVEVCANRMEDAIRIAEAAFQNGQNFDRSVKDGPEGIWGNTTNLIKETNITASLERM